MLKSSVKLELQQDHMLTFSVQATANRVALNPVANYVFFFVCDHVVDNRHCKMKLIFHISSITRKRKKNNNVLNCFATYLTEQ